jgi:hexokinase
MESYTRQFDVNVKEMYDVVEKFQKEMENGLKGVPSSLLIVPSYTDVPKGDEAGVFLAIDFGGTNLRCLLVKFFESKVVDCISRVKLLDNTIESGEVLFSAIADFIIAFLEENNSYLTPNADLPTGFTFSFPVRQTSISSGFLVRWTKG